MFCYCDFHIHSCLSPCGQPEMTPSNIARMAALQGYNIIAVSDHNTTGNCRAVIRAAAEAGIVAIPAMELTTSEECICCVSCPLRMLMSSGNMSTRDFPTYAMSPVFL